MSEIKPQETLALKKFKVLKSWLSGLSFKTGVCVLAVCAVFYAMSFASFLFPVSYSAKGILWAVFFGLAKTAQYSGLLILGKVGVQKVKGYFTRKKQNGKSDCDISETVL